MEDSSCPSEGEEGEVRKFSQGSAKTSCAANVSVVWSGAYRRTPFILFRADAVQGLNGPIDHPFSSPHRLTYKIAGSECRLVHTLLLVHGFSEVSCSSSRFNLYWSGTHVLLPELRGLAPHQKVNHFPRSYVITRKDRLYYNITRMQQSKGMKYFNIIPVTFTLPEELAQFQVAFRKRRGTWIMKPVSSSRGRGISVINHPNQVSRSEHMVVSQYIDNPLCVNGYKFDLRIYAAVTSFNPLRVYLYEEGLTRFATEQYSGPVQLDNLCMHLTNYSVNKKNAHYVRCESAGRDDYGSKWSMSALLRHLHSEGRDVAEMMMKVEDVVIKALIAGETHISGACEVFESYRGNCFELYGFDILIDETLRPWLLEVNLSPSLGCDAPLDLRLKSNLLADLFTLVGVPVCNPYTRETPKPPKFHESHRKPSLPPSTLRLTSEKVGVVRESREEYARRGGFVRIFPSHDSWELYSSFLESKGRRNYLLHSQLYPDRVKGSQSIPCSLSTIIAKRFSVAATQLPSTSDYPSGLTALERTAVYLRKLENGPKPKPTWDTVKELFLPGEKSSRATPLTPPTSSASDPLDCLTSNITKLSKVQARKLFAAYLKCVQKRLAKEGSVVDLEPEPADDTANFEVVVSFLKRAAQNLTSPFTLVEPSTRFPIRDRKSMLARQLAEFISLYNQETVQLATNPNDAPGVPTELMGRVLSQASEKDLESLLATYARHSHSSAAAQADTQPLHSSTAESRVVARTTPQSTTRDGRLKASADSVLQKKGRNLGPRSNVMSRCLRRQSGVPGERISSHSLTKVVRTSSAGSPYIYGHTCVPLDVPASPPVYISAKYSEDLLRSRQADREKTMASAASDSRPPQGPGRVARGQGGVRGERRERGGGGGEGDVGRGRRLLQQRQHSLSTQSLLSVSSDASGAHSLKSVQSVGISSESSVDISVHRAQRPQSAVVASKMKSYVSPYAQPVRKRSPLLQRKSASTGKARQRGTHNPPNPPWPPRKRDLRVDSITEALHKLTMRQISRHRTQSTATYRGSLLTDVGRTRASGTSSTADRARLEAPVSSAHPGSGTELGKNP